MLIMLSKWLKIILSKHQLQKSYDFQIYLTCCDCRVADITKEHSKKILLDILYKLLIKFHLDILLE